MHSRSSSSLRRLLGDNQHNFCSRRKYHRLILSFSHCSNDGGSTSSINSQIRRPLSSSLLCGPLHTNLQYDQLSGRRGDIERPITLYPRSYGRMSTAVDDPSKFSNNVQLELDFFGEPVTFVGLTSETQRKAIGSAMAALDGCLLTVVSKGLSCTEGGEEAGMEVQSAHSSAISWTELLRYAAVWNQKASDEESDERSQMSSPMLAVVAVAPVLIQAGLAYVMHLDKLLKQTKPAAPGFPPIQIHEIAHTAAKCDENHLNPRERLHLQALRYLLRDDFHSALATYLHILRSCPGDALAISLAMDLCQTVGDKNAALRAAGSISAYWQERRGGLITPSIPGHSMATALVALGFAVGGKMDDAELMADRAMNRGKKFSGALATWAQCHVYDAKGRVSEGISALSNFDGIRNYEGAGFLFFDCRLSGYGARFSLDREERGRGKSSALRLYENNFDRVLGYSGFSEGQPWRQPRQRAPLAWKETKAIETGDSSSSSSSSPSFLDRILGRKQSEPQEKQTDYELLIQQVNYPSTKYDGWEPSAEDVLTWLPPTPQFLSDATLLLLRFTFNGTISNRNARWDNIKNAWAAMLDIHREHGSSRSLSFCPLASVVASLLFPPHETGGDRIGTGRLAEGLHRLGELLKLGNPETYEQKQTAVREIVAERSPSFWLPADENERPQWKAVVDLISSAVDGLDYVDPNATGGAFRASPSLRFQTWDFEARPLLEHSIVFAACKSGDTESLCLARSICSQGVTLRGNSPEEWWRYSIVLGLLGDEVGSEDALTTSVNTGGGQGSKSFKGF